MPQKDDSHAPSDPLSCWKLGKGCDEVQPPPCVDGSAPTKSNNPSLSRNVGLGGLALFAVAGGAFMVINVVGFPEAEAAEGTAAATGTAAGGFDLLLTLARATEPARLAPYAGAYALIPGGAFGYFATTATCAGSANN